MVPPKAEVEDKAAWGGDRVQAAAQAMRVQGGVTGWRVHKPRWVHVQHKQLVQLLGDKGASRQWWAGLHGWPRSAGSLLPGPEQWLQEAGAEILVLSQ